MGNKELFSAWIAVWMLIENSDISPQINDSKQ